MEICPLKPSILCSVCQRKAQGVHFGVASCRACAAFFRRRAGSKLDQRACANSQCGVNYFLCKPCRLQKCYDAGMDEKKFQFDRDLTSSSSSSSTHCQPKWTFPQSFDTFIGRPQFVHFCDPESPSISKSFIDLTWLIDKGTRILRNGPVWTPHTDKGPLRRLARFHDIKEKLPKNMATNSTFSAGDCSDCWEYYFLTTATWLTNFPQFDELQLDVKLAILVAIWHMWGRLDKLAVTALARKRGLLASRSMIAQSNGLFLDVDTLKLDMSWTSRYTLEEVEFFIDGFRQWDLMVTVDQFIALDPSEIELNYMLAQMSFEYAGKRYQGEILKICERFQEILADDLHNYYVNERRISNYSGRLSRLMKINNAVQKSVWNRRPKTEIAKTLNIFTAEFSHPEIFHDTGF